MRSLVVGQRYAGRPELVVVPGLGALGYLLPALRACAAWTRVHLLDLPGFGAARTAHCPASLDDVARAAAAWLRAVPAEPVLLVGHSTGGQAALRAVAAAPGTVSALVLSGMTFPPSARRPGRLAVRALRTAVHESPRELPAVLPEYARGRLRVLELLRSALRDRPEDVLPGLTVPVTVVRGRYDALCDAAWAERLARLAGDGRVVVLPGAHNTPTTHPVETAAAWRDALR